MTHEETKAQIQLLLSEPLGNSSQCHSLCLELQETVDLIQNATGERRVQLLARLKAIDAQRMALNCGECLFE